MILYRGAFAYDLADAFVEDLAAGFAALGREVVFVDLTDRAGRGARLQEELSRPFECIVSINAIGSRPADAPPGTHFYDSLAAPYVAVLIDHPACHLGRLTIGNMIVTSYDRSHVAFLERYFGGARRVAFLPHGGSVAAGAGAPGERPIDLLFPGTYSDPDAAFDALRHAGPPGVFDVLDYVVERLLAADCEPLEEALAAVLADEGRQDEWRGLCPLMPVVESFVKAHKRREILERLDRAGIAVDILGNGWPAERFRRHRVLPARPYREALRLMREAKLVLNMGFVPDGSHERVFSALLNGALPAADHNPYLDELFGDGRDILLFRWTRLDELPGRLAAALGDRDRLRRHAERAPALAADHTWAARAAAIVELVKRAR
ncbi:MAG: glycosyltransferase family 1 protein [Burkholderiales bacterium]|nr:glycosyltransferase family 1 protein [Burkholderiales bacterium]